MRTEVDAGSSTRRACRRVGTVAGVHPGTVLAWWRGSARPGDPDGPDGPAVGAVTVGRGLPRGRALAVTRLVAVLGLALLGADLTVGDVLPVAGVAVAGLLPVWAVALGRYPGARAVLLLAGAALAGGLVLVLLPGAREIEPRYAVATATRTLAVVLGFGFTLWCRWFLPREAVALAYGAGALAVNLTRLPGSENGWKYQLALPVTIVVLALAQCVRGRARTAVVLAALAGLGALSVLHDYRSFFGFAALTALVVGWQAVSAARRRRRYRRRPGATLATWVASGTLLAVGGFTLYRAAEQLLLSGAFGTVLQERSQAQVRAAGSLLAGGRPEWAGTWSLMRHDPAGFGPGAIPRPQDVLVAREGLATVGIGPDNGYVDNYMFGGQFRLHSTVADAWSNFGWVGVAFALLLAGLLVRALLDHLTDRTADALVLLLGLRALWDLAFGPMYSNLPDVALALALALRPRARGLTAARVPAGRGRRRAAAAG
ncbi:hypothetical protein [Kineococcus sp. SYSU DK001]|uniref:hypothetical protein n=1 Tax=Kineococcus sp. SYSU DK001 TaxID=3383122 RepID=UPI003D7D9209